MRNALAYIYTIRFAESLWIICHRWF